MWQKTLQQIIETTIHEKLIKANQISYKVTEILALPAENPSFSY